MAKRLYRSREKRIVLGICGGIADYFDVDPVLIRAILIFFMLAGGSGILAYLIAYFFIPLEDAQF